MGGKCHIPIGSDATLLVADIAQHIYCQLAIGRQITVVIIQTCAVDIGIGLTVNITTVAQHASHIQADAFTCQYCLFGCLVHTLVVYALGLNRQLFFGANVTIGIVQQASRLNAHALCC